MGRYRGREVEGLQALEVPRAVYEKLAKTFPADLQERMAENYRWGDTVTIDVLDLTPGKLRELAVVAEAVDKKFASTVHRIVDVLEDDDVYEVKRLEELPVALLKFFGKNKLDGYYYRKGSSGEPLPFLVTSIQFQKADKRKDDSVRVTASANSQGSLDSDSFAFGREAVRENANLAELLATVGVVHENQRLRMQYRKHLEQYQEKVNCYANQFVVQGSIAGYRYYDRDSHHSGNWWRSGGREDREMNMTMNGEGSLHRVLVVEEELEDRTYQPFATDVWQEKSALPFHAYIYTFALDLHEFLWIHASDLRPYEYNVALRDKLILPPEHGHLIDALVEDLDTFKEDVIQGKSGGSVILCTGKPGLGKTLTAEVYSEVAKRPLYKVSSGQLGVEHEELEENLKRIIGRADRWKCVLLIDEVDVYVRARGDDMEQNAIVAAFLLTMEYSTGLMFLTSNRGDDIDDAIRSRCVAIVKYEMPSKEDCRRIWRVLATNYGMEVSDKMIDQLVEKFGAIAGRDVKNLLRLTDKFCRARKEAPSIKAFQTCAMFRGL